MQATVEDLHSALVAVTMLLGVMVASDPLRQDLIRAFRMSLDALDEEPEWQAVAARAKAYGEVMIANLEKPQPPDRLIA